MSSSLLPRNATPQERAIEAATARMADVDVPLRDLWNPATCPEPLLPWLAWALSIDSWKSYWPVEIKRARVASALDIQRRKGTAQSVQDVVASFGGAVVITEWWQTEPKGDPHTFHADLTLSGRGGETASAAYVDDVIAEINRTKPVRSHFDFTQSSSLYGAVGVAAVVRPCIYARLNCTAEAA
jgi:phage tail P2-like protein